MSMVALWCHCGCGLEPQAPCRQASERSRQSGFQCNTDQRVQGNVGGFGKDLIIRSIPPINESSRNESSRNAIHCSFILCTQPPYAQYPV
jgi:hypothetical protein